MDYQLSDQTLRLSEKVARATMGIDALYVAEKADEDGLVVLNMANVPAEPFASYDEGSTTSRRASRFPPSAAGARDSFPR